MGGDLRVRTQRGGMRTCVGWTGGLSSFLPFFLSSRGAACKCGCRLVWAERAFSSRQVDLLSPPPYPPTFFTPSPLPLPLPQVGLAPPLEGGASTQPSGTFPRRHWHHLACASVAMRRQLAAAGGAARATGFYALSPADQARVLAALAPPP